MVLHRDSQLIMRKLFLIVLLCGLLCAQSVGPVAITSTQCAPIGTDRMATVYLQITGTWTGTLTPKVAIAGNAPVPIQVTPSNSQTPQSSITANGGYFVHVAGWTYFQVCGNTVASGTANVYLNASPASH